MDQSYLNIIYGFSNMTPLQLAARDNDMSKVKQLIYEGADVNERDNYERTALHHAITKNKDESHYEVCEILLNNGADVNAVDCLGLTPIFYLVGNGNLRIIEELFIKNFKADFKMIYSHGISLLLQPRLYYGNEKNSEAIVKLLVDLGLDVNHRDKNGGSPLSSACSVACKSIKIVKFFMRKGANINTVDNDGKMPLNRAFNYICHWNDVPLEKIKKNMKFIMEHTDFSLVCKVMDPFLSNYPAKEECAIKIILEHLAELQDLDISIHPNLMDSISRKENYESYYKKCQEELVLSKCVKPENSWINLHNLLLDSRKKLKNYAGNEDLIEDFKNREEWVLEKFPIYGASIKENLKKAIERRRLFDKSSVLLSFHLPTFNPTHLVIKDILDCILSVKDLSKFCN